MPEPAPAAPAPPGAPRHTPPGDPGSRPGPTGDGPRDCWHCREPLDPREPLCASCGSPRTHVLLLCDSPCLELAQGPGAPLNLGRDPGWSPRTAAAFTELLRISRRHATVTVEADGSAWVEEAAASGSLNHTYLNGARITPGLRTPLRDGDELRLGLRVVGFSVRLYGPG
ncbi:FHA domain-containing protein [Streptomyces sp. NPDC001889]